MPPHGARRMLFRIRGPQRCRPRILRRRIAFMPAAPAAPARTAAPSTNAIVAVLFDGAVAPVGGVSPVVGSIGSGGASTTPIFATATVAGS